MDLILLLLRLDFLHLLNSFGLDDYEAAIATTHMQEASIRTDNDSQDWLVNAHLQPSKPEHAGQHPQHNVALLCAIDKLVHVQTVLDYLQRDDVGAVLRQHSLIGASLLHCLQLAQISQQCSIYLV